MKSSAAALCLLLLVPACAHLDYMGRSYPRTSNVELFFAEADVAKPYEVMGRVSARAHDIVSSEKLQRKIIEKAKDNGADAVVILGMERHETGQTTSYSESTEDKKRGTKTTGTATTTTQVEKQVEAIFLKYKAE